MKRIIALAFAVVMLAGSFSAARADGIDVKVQGEWDFAFGWSVNPGFKNSVHNDAARGQQDNFIARQRVRTQINFIASEYLQGVLMFEIGDIDWGNEPDGVKTGRGSGGSLDADGVNVETKRAYLDWIIPYTEVSVRMGIQGLMLPSTPMGTPVLSSDVAGIIVSSPITDWMSASALWVRPFNQYFSDEESGFDFAKDNLADESDIFGLLLPMEFGDIGLNITPWFLYGFAGANSGIYDYLFTGEYVNTVEAKHSRSNVYWIGTHLEFNLLDPLVLNLEGIYGHMRRTDLTYLGRNPDDPDDFIIGDWNYAYNKGYSN
ncbi:MAG: hypothetical protein LBH65_01815, partial [Desulfovibrio sp.]|nr:hypothetical protein [Desulfovibrio sp.]